MSAIQTIGVAGGLLTVNAALGYLAWLVWNGAMNWNADKRR